MKLIEIINQLQEGIAPVNTFYNTKWSPTRPIRNDEPPYIEFIVNEFTGIGELWEDDNYDGGGSRNWFITYEDLIDNNWEWYYVK